MERTSLSVSRVPGELENLAHTLKQSRFFQKISTSLLIEMMRQGEIVRLGADENLIREKEPRKPEIYVLVEGVLAVTSNETFLMRLDKPGDVAGEMSFISGTGHSATVIAETDTTVIAFPQSLFEVEEGATRVPVAYLVFNHILSEKLRVMSAQVMLGGNFREVDDSQPLIGLVDEDEEERTHACSILERLWDNKELKVFESIPSFVETEQKSRYDLLILDPIGLESGGNQENLRDLIAICELASEELLVISRFAEDPEQRRLLAKWGVSEFIAKPYSDFDLEHALNRLRVMYYRRRELRKVEHAADTDQLTGLANRRRLDEFVQALVTVYPDHKVPFSLIICDIDNFKHYNDTHGHQLGDVVLSKIAGILTNRVRRGDLVARFGGEEFVVILPRCGKGNALAIAEQLRRAVEDEDIPHQEQQPLGNLTSTFGVATFPDDAADVEALLKKADDCLYEGKDAGRNVVVGASAVGS